MPQLECTIPELRSRYVAEDDIHIHSQRYLQGLDAQLCGWQLRGKASLISSMSTRFPKMTTARRTAVILDPVDLRRSCVGKNARNMED